MSTTSDYPQLLEVDAEDEVCCVGLTANSEQLVFVAKKSVQVWRIKDGKCIAKMPVEHGGRCVVASRDGRWIGAGTKGGEVLVWDTTTGFKRVFANKIGPGIIDVDFSAVDSTQFLCSDANKVSIWDIVARRKVRTFNLGVAARARYSPQGDRIATATQEWVRVWDSNDGRILVNINVTRHVVGLLWRNNHLFVATGDNVVKQIDGATGLIVSEWAAPIASRQWFMDLPQHGKFIAYAANHTITFRDTTTHAPFISIQSTHDIHSISCSSDGQTLAFATIAERKIIVKDLSSVTSRFVLLHGSVASFQEPDLAIDNATLNAWRRGQLTDAEALLSMAISTSQDTAHHAFASRALVRARLGSWDTALADAEESIKIQSSAIGYIAKCVTLIGKGDTLAGCRACDIASLHIHADHVSLLLLIKAVVLFMAGEYDDAISRVDDLIAVRSSDSMLHVVQAYMHDFLAKVHVENSNYERAVQLFEHARIRFGDRKEQPPLIISLISGWKFDDLATPTEQRFCEALLTTGRIQDARESVLRIVGGETRMSESTKVWVSEFMQRCLSAPESSHNSASHPTRLLLRDWAEIRLTTGTWKDALASATGFMPPRTAIYQAICEQLEMTGHEVEAVACFHQMCREQVQGIDDMGVTWTRGFKSRCCGKFEDLGDVAMNINEYDEAISHYTTALSLGPAVKHDILVKRSAALVAKGEWDGALKDANEVVKLDPSSPLGYERRHGALHGMKRYDDASRAFEEMLSKMSESTDPHIRERSHRYVFPEQTKETIRKVVGDTIRDCPPVLIDTRSGRLCNKWEQAAAFESTPAFTRLISSTTIHIDRASIAEEVGGFYRYATFSHRWEDNEPLFETVLRVVVYELAASPTHEKLQMFCKIVREAGFNWAWSDTCCINKGDHFALEEALVSMFKWYERSAVTIIFLRGVGRRAKRGALTRSIWNMRAWTLQEYHASKVVRIYTEDWTPYLGLEIYNHKESPEIISEMEEATGISARALMELRPGLHDIREKLRLASTRETTRVEDAAYSLLGIFSVSLPITYGEGDKALGRLLSQLLTSSGDVSILGWTGRSGSFNSCLPSSITVFRHPPTSHVPPAFADSKPQSIIPGLRSPDLILLANLYDRLNGLPVPWFVGRRMKLPCLTFKLGHVHVLLCSNGSEHVFRARTNGLGIVEIRTEEDLSQLGPLYLVHPWIEFLLDRQPFGNVLETTAEGNTDDRSTVGELPLLQADASNLTSTTQKTRTARLLGRLGRTFGRRPIASVQDNSSLLPLAGGRSLVSIPDNVSLLPPSTVSPLEKQMRVLQFVARLKQPFGALLLAATRRHMDEYRRVAAETLITVQIKEITPEILDKFMSNVRILDVL